MASRKLFITTLLLALALSSMSLSLGARHLLQTTSSPNIPTIPTLTKPTTFSPLPSMGVNIPPLPSIPSLPKPTLSPLPSMSIPTTIPTLPQIYKVMMFSPFRLF
ncbi:hypothetical protein Lal_00041373 [Lupinus albus]|nr:hypothetical protein Lal_00041373 [Lupinus albus]